MNNNNNLPPYIWVVDLDEPAKSASYKTLSQTDNTYTCRFPVLMLNPDYHVPDREKPRAVAKYRTNTVVLTRKSDAWKNLLFAANHQEQKAKDALDQAKIALAAASTVCVQVYEMTPVPPSPPKLIPPGPELDRRVAALRGFQLKYSEDLSLAQELLTAIINLSGIANGLRRSTEKEGWQVVKFGEGIDPDLPVGESIPHAVALAYLVAFGGDIYV